MRLIDADKLIYSNIKTNGYGYVEVIETVVLEQDIANAKTVQVIPLAKVKQAREEIEQNAYPIVHGVNNHDMGMTLNGIFQVLDKLIAESEEK